ncbi:MAG: hydrogenase expression/formation protein HypE [Candidatus Zixiibacteriota bacterium]|nr:MAG: hydrogenase expression/formation protein HypE [candidate division Zixibacteria bacterium]
MSVDSYRDQEPGRPDVLAEHPHISIAHGSGGRLMHQLIDNVFAPLFKNPDFESQHDGALLEIAGAKLAFTTDSYVVNPLFFPGGDIGTLAVCGTVNDLAMCGARPLYLCASFIIEEGFPTDSLWRIALSMRQAAMKAGVHIVSGDTKVVDRGCGDGVYITTSGVGLVNQGLEISPRAVKPGDAIIINGDIGRHGIAVMSQREGLSFETRIESDCAPLGAPVMQLLEKGIDIHCLRDLTRGGLATTLVEIAESSCLHIGIDDRKVPIRDEVLGACEMLGLDPMYVANEGRFVAFVPAREAEQTVAILGDCSPDLTPVIIGEVSDGERGVVTMKSIIDAERIVDMLSGEQLPRIC